MKPTCAESRLDDPTKVGIWQLLLHYDGARSLVPQFTKAFERSVTQVRRYGWFYVFSGLDASPPPLSSWVEELQYIESLDAAARDRYLQIRRLVFRADAFARRGARPAPAAHPSVLAYDWQEGDERFLPHLLDSGRPFAIVIVEAPISEAGLAWLKEQAESGPWSDDVKTQIRQALVRREERTKQQGQDLRR